MHLFSILLLTGYPLVIGILMLKIIILACMELVTFAGSSTLHITLPMLKYKISKIVLHLITNSIII